MTAAVMKAKIAAGRFGQAEAIARTMPVGYRAPALTELVRALAASGNLGKAEDVARTFTDPYSQATALITVAQEMADTGDQGRSARLAATAEAVYCALHVGVLE